LFIVALANKTAGLLSSVRSVAESVSSELVDN